MSLRKVSDYISKTEHDMAFVQKEMESFKKHLPQFAQIVIAERDEYLSHSICELATLVGALLNRANPNPSLSSSPGGGGGGGGGLRPRPKIVAVVGAGHLVGIQKCILEGTSSPLLLFLYPP
jgi:pheromone shutdown protein TraB